MALIPVMRPKVVNPELSFGRLQDVANSRVFSNYGPQVRELERRVAELFGVSASRVATATNATLAITGAMAVSQAVSWKIPAWTFAATAHATTSLGLPFRFVDVSAETWMIDPSTITSGKEGTVVVLPFGIPLVEANWDNAAEVVVDAAASFGSMFNQFPELPANTSVVFSLHVTKVIGVGEGAVIIFGDADRAEAFRSWSNFGFAGSRDSVSAGTNAKMCEFVAALLHSELDHWPQALHEWKNLRAIVDTASDEAGLALQPSSRGIVGPYWIAVLQDNEARKKVESGLAEAGIQTRRWWGPGLHRMQAFRGIPFDNLQQTEDVASRYLGLPFFRDLTSTQVHRIVSAVEATLAG